MKRLGPHVLSLIGVGVAGLALNAACEIEGAPSAPRGPLPSESPRGDGGYANIGGFGGAGGAPDDAGVGGVGGSDQSGNGVSGLSNGTIEELGWESVFVGVGPAPTPVVCATVVSEGEPDSTVISIERDIATIPGAPGERLAITACACKRDGDDDPDIGAGCRTTFPVVRGDAYELECSRITYFDDDSVRTRSCDHYYREVAPDGATSPTL